MRNDGTYISSIPDAETGINKIHRKWLFLRGLLYTYWNQKRFAKVGKGFYAPGPISVVNGRRITIGENVFLGEHCQLYSYPEGEIFIGNNSSIDRYAEIRGGKHTKIGENVRIVKGATIKSSDSSIVSIGNRTIISQGCILNGDIRVGEDVIFGPQVFVNAADHGFATREVPMNQQSGVQGPVVIEDDVWIGYSVVLLKGVHIERGSIIGSSAVVNKSVPAYSINVGVPAKTIKFRDE